jgi:hypothetical protein
MGLKFCFVLFRLQWNNVAQTFYYIIVFCVVFAFGVLAFRFVFVYMGEIMQSNIPAIFAVFCIFAVVVFFAVDVIMPVNSSFSFLGASLSDGCVLVKLLCVFRL